MGRPILIGCANKATTTTTTMSIIATFLCLVTAIIFSYTKIFFNLRRHENQVQDHVQQPNPRNQLNIARYKKAVSSAIWLQLTLVACYLPYGVVAASHARIELSPSLLNAGIYTATLVFLNSSLNPLLYCWKLDEVRQAIRQVLCLRFFS